MINEKLSKVVDWLERNWIGQPRENIEVLVVSVILRENPLLFATPGTGKTDAARAIARLLGLKFKKIGCSEARKSLSGALYRLMIKQNGNEISYYAAFDSIKPEEYAVILIDEVNRAPAQLHNELLGLLEEGILTTTFGDAYKVNWRFVLVMNPYAGTIDRALLDRTVAIPVKVPQFTTTYAILQDRLDGKLVKHFSDKAEEIISGKDIPHIIDEISKVKISKGIQFLATMLNYALTCREIMEKDQNLFSGIFACEGSCPFRSPTLYTNITENNESIRIEIAQLCHQVKYPPAPRSIIKTLTLAKGLAFIRGKNEVTAEELVDAARFVYLKYLNNSRLIDALVHPGRLRLYTYTIKLIKKVLNGDKSQNVVKQLLELSNIDIGIHNTVNSLIKEVLGAELEKLLEGEL